jgi:signal transduction histidine kinase
MIEESKNTEVLERENERLKELNAFKSDVISISAHEMRTSLSALKWILKMFLDGDVGALNAEQGNLMKKAYDSNERMIGLVNEMLSINHSDEVNLTYELEKTQIENIIDEVLFDFMGESYKRRIELIFLKPETPMPLLYIDQAKIRVVIQGLIENAIKYSNEGGKVFITTKHVGESVEISVKDTGISINEEDKPHIFEKFFRARNAKERDSVGSGFGLYTAKNIIEHHKGKIWFEAKEGLGSTFYISLPITKI